MAEREIVKVTAEFYCWADEAEEVRDSVTEWFSNEEHTLVGIEVKTQPDSDEHVRAEMEEGEGNDWEEIEEV